MTIYELVRLYKEKKPDGHFFDEDTLRFFGEALSRMRVLKGTKVVKDRWGEEHTCYVISATRHKDWTGDCEPYIYYHYFDVETLTDVSV